jgi:hypothetical protein
MKNWLSKKIRMLVFLKKCKVRLAVEKVDFGENR